MKPITKRLLAFASAAAITMTTIPTVKGLNMNQNPDEIALDWASMEADTTNALIPELVRSAPTGAPLTRQGLCAMVMNAYKAMTGLTDEDLGEKELVFTDTNDIDVLNAYHLGLITADSTGIFAPDEPIARQDFFTVAVKLLETAGYSYVNEIEMDLSVFADSDQLLAYAKQPVQVLMCIGTIADDGSAILAPERAVSAEEALGMLDHIVSYYTEWAENPEDPQPDLGPQVADFALNYVGCRYVRGAKGPNKFDCSGFVYYVYKQFGYTVKPNTQNQWNTLSTRVRKADLEPGDVLFFSRNGKASGIFHVGIYIGDGEFVHAANSRRGVIVSGLNEEWYANRYLGAKRVIN